MRLTKKILQEGTYWVNTPGGERVQQTFDAKRIDKHAEVSNNMLNSGLKIPAPFDHNIKAKPGTEQEVQVFEDSPAKAYHNAGYWTKFHTKEENGKKALYGEIEVPGDPNDPNSPAYKLQNTAKEVSMSVAKNWIDGLGRSWEDGIVHVAVVNHPVVPDQTPFEEGVTIVNMSSLVSDSSESTDVTELVTALKKAKINLPASTTSETFMRDLLVALSQLDESGSDRIEPVPIYMSTSGENEVKLNEAQAKALVDSGAVNPATNKPFTFEDLGLQTPAAPQVDLSTGADDKSVVAALKKEVEQFKQTAIAFQARFLKDKKEAISSRISSLLSKGLIKKEYAENHLYPKVEFNLSIANGEIQDHPLEATLSALEAIEIPESTDSQSFAASSFPEGAATVPFPADNGSELSEAEMKEVLDSIQGLV